MNLINLITLSAAVVGGVDSEHRPTLPYAFTFAYHSKAVWYMSAIV